MGETVILPLNDPTFSLRFHDIQVCHISWVEALQNHDPPVRVFFEQENPETMSQTGGIVLFVPAMVAREESRMKSEAILLSLMGRLSRGLFLTPGLFGYYRIDVPDGFGGYKKKSFLSMKPKYEQSDGYMRPCPAKELRKKQGRQ